jgi:hypothetical protein
MHAWLVMSIVMMRCVAMGMLLPQHRVGDAHLLRDIKNLPAGQI